MSGLSSCRKHSGKLFKKLSVRLRQVLEILSSWLQWEPLFWVGRGGILLQFQLWETEMGKLVWAMWEWPCLKTGKWRVGWEGFHVRATEVTEDAFSSKKYNSWESSFEYIVLTMIKASHKGLDGEVRPGTTVAIPNCPFNICSWQTDTGS